MIAFDTETTGVDLYHGARPFFVTLYDDNGVQTHYEWDVDPLTRRVKVPLADRTRLQALVNRWAETGEEVVGQNIKFDVAALASIGVTNWPWQTTEDTLIAGHVLASNQPHDLTAMGVHYLGVNIYPHEERLKQATVEARGYCRRNFGDRWKTARFDLPQTPSAKKSSNRKEEKAWRFDTWLPKALFQYLGTDGGGHEFWNTVLAEYGNADSSLTLKLWRVMKTLLGRRGLWAVYREQMRLPPIISSMQTRGVTLSGERCSETKEEFRAESERLGSTCVNIAADYGYELLLPRNGVNNSLREFCFEVLRLEPVYNTKSKTDAPTLDSKNAIPYYLDTLRQGSKELAFIRSLADKRAYDTALTYIESYQRFMLPVAEANLGSQWWVLHPSLNQTGTDTLRFTCGNPNAQQISKKEKANLRYLFGPAPGREWWSLDAKNIELRLPAYECGEADLIALFERPNDPPFYGSEHLLNFSVVYPDLWEGELGKVCDNPKCCDGKVVDLTRVGPHIKKKFASSWYQRCKNGDFAVGYGAVDRENGLGTADRTFGRPGSHARLKARFAKKEALNNKWVVFAGKYGYVETMPDRRVDPERGYPLLCQRSERGQVKPTVPLNYRVQGTAMWWMRRAMVRCQEQLDHWNEKCFGGHIVLQVHDELVFDLPAAGDPSEDYRKEKLYGKLPLFRTSNLWRVRALQALMAQGGEDLIPRVPTPVGCEYHAENWAEGVTMG